MTGFSIGRIRRSSTSTPSCPAITPRPLRPTAGGAPSTASSMPSTTSAGAPGPAPPGGGGAEPGVLHAVDDVGGGAELLEFRAHRPPLQVLLRVRVLGV